MKDSSEGDEGRFSGVKGVRVLLMEDNAVNVLVATQFLKSWEVEVDVASNGVEGLKLIDQLQHLIHAFSHLEAGHGLNSFETWFSHAFFLVRHASFVKGQHDQEELLRWEC